MNERERHTVEGKDREAARVAAFVRGRDASCPNCGYNVRNLSNRRCLECGKLLKLVRILIPKYRDDRLWNLAVLAACVMTPVWFIVFAHMFSSQRDGLLAPAVCLVIAACSVALAVGLIVRRRRFLAMPPARQRFGPASFA